MAVNLALSARIKHYRTALGLTQEEFASEIGVAALQISCIERGTKGISLEALIEISRKFQISMNDLVPVSGADESLKEQWIDDILQCLRTMDTVQVGFLKRMVAG
jgi:transcriptional regulator with XRE-family HTH domain